MNKLLLNLFVFATVVFMASVSYAAGNVERIYFLNYKGIISGITTDYIADAIETADKSGAVALVITLDTPGGLLDSTKDIVQQFYSSPVPIVVYVAPQGAQAGSAGTFITLAADYAVMSPGSSIGAAHPVGLTGNLEGEIKDKALNSTESFMRSIAEKRNRNVSVAVSTVTESRSLTASEALDAGIIDAIADSDEALVVLLTDLFELKSAPIRFDITPSFTEKISFGLSNPNLLTILFLLGALLIFLEIKAPGTFVFAGAGLVCMVLFLIGTSIIPINLLALFFILLGIVAVVAEFFISSFGALAVGGVISIVFGLRMLFDTDGSQGVSVSFFIILPIVIVFMAVVVTISRLIIKDFKRKPAVGAESLIGSSCEVLKWDNGMGSVLVNGEIWSAVSDDILGKGDKCLVIDIDGLTLTVGTVKHPQE